MDIFMKNVQKIYLELCRENWFDFLSWPGRHFRGKRIQVGLKDFKILGKKWIEYRWRTGRRISKPRMLDKYIYEIT